MSDKPFSRLYPQAKYTSSCSACGKRISAGTPLRWTPQEDAHGRRKGPPLTEHPDCYEARIAREKTEKEDRQRAERERIEALLRERPELMPSWKPDPERAIDRIRAVGRSI